MPPCLNDSPITLNESKEVLLVLLSGLLHRTSCRGKKPLCSPCQPPDVLLAPSSLLLSVPLISVAAASFFFLLSCLSYSLSLFFSPFNS